MLLCIRSVFAQTDDCEKIYTIVEELPEYKKGTSDLMKYINTEVLSELKYMGAEKTLITSLRINFIVDKKGNVRDVSFPEKEKQLTSLCKAKMEKKLLAMKGWTSGKQAGKPVCVAFELPINCILWDDRFDYF